MRKESLDLRFKKVAVVTNENSRALKDLLFAVLMKVVKRFF